MRSIGNPISAAGLVGLLGAVLVGSGEFLLHFDALGRFGAGGTYDFMRGISADRTSTGHFLAVLGAPLYLVGFWHIMKMLEPASRLAARMAFAVLSYGILIGAVWIGSRAGISAIVNDASINHPAPLIALYDWRYENLLQLTRVCVLVFSIIFIWLALTGRSRYPRWIATLSPIVLILASFVLWAAAPAVGVYVMPIALNIAFALLFLPSIYFSLRDGV